MNHARHTRIALFLMGELVAALRANDSDLFKRWLYGGIEDLGEPAVTEMRLWLVQHRWQQMRP